MRALSTTPSNSPLLGSHVHRSIPQGWSASSLESHHLSSPEGDTSSQAPGEMRTRPSRPPCPRPVGHSHRVHLQLLDKRRSRAPEEVSWTRWVASTLAMVGSNSLVCLSPFQTRVLSSDIESIALVCC